MKRDISSLELKRWVNLVIAFFSLIAVGAYLIVAISRLDYPYAIEWVEPNTFGHIVRIIERLPIYQAPSFEFIPMTYTPGYYYVSALWATISRDPMFSMRLVSLLSSLIACSFIFLIAWDRKVPGVFCLLAVGLFAAAYKFVGYWYDLARVDSMMLALLLSGYYLAIKPTKNDRCWGATAGILLAAAFFTKQQALLLGLVIPLALIVQRRWNKAIAYGLSYLISMGAGFLVLSYFSGGWFWFYTIQVPAAHPLQLSMLIDFWRNYLIPVYWPLMFIIILAIFTYGHSNERLHDYLFFLATFVIPMIATSYLSSLKIWWYFNNFIPAVAALSLAGAEAAYYLSTRNILGNFKSVGSLLCLGLILGQFFLLRYDPRKQIPPLTSWITGDQIVQKLRDLPRPVYAPTDSYLLYMAGLPMNSHLTSVGDLTAASEHSDKVKAILEPYQEHLLSANYLSQVKTALLAEHNSIEKYFIDNSHFNCENLERQGKILPTLTGAEHSIKWICHQ